MKSKPAIRGRRPYKSRRVARNAIRANGNFIVFGAPCSGKSTLMSELLRALYPIAADVVAPDVGRTVEGLSPKIGNTRLKYRLDPRINLNPFAVPYEAASKFVGRRGQPLKFDFSDKNLGNFNAVVKGTPGSGMSLFAMPSADHPQPRPSAKAEVRCSGAPGAFTKGQR